MARSTGSGGIKSWLWNRVKKSHGLTKLFWLILFAVGSIVPIAGIDRTKEVVKTQIVARVKQMLPGGHADVTTSFPGGDASSPIRVYFTTPDLPKEQSQIARAVVDYI